MATLSAYETTFVIETLVSLVKFVCKFIVLPIIGCLVVLMVVLTVTEGSNSSEAAKTEVSYNLSKKAANKACFNSYLNSNIMSMGKIRYKNTYTTKTGNNAYYVAVQYTANGYTALYQCDVFLSGGKTMLTIN